MQQEILWDASDPDPFTTADHDSPTSSSPGHIRVRGTYNAGPHRGEERSFEEMWGEVVFELYNINNVKDFNQLTAEAAAGKLSKEEFVTKVVECEDIAAEKARAFYIHAFLPWAKDHQVSTRPETWYIPSRSHLGENARSRSIDKNGPYWQHYQLSYDLIIMQSLVDDGQHEKAIKLAAKLLENAATITDRIAIYCARGATYGRNGDPDEAIADFTEALRLDPKNGQAYCGRGHTWAAKGDYGKAVADLTEAQRLVPIDAHSLDALAWLRAWCVDERYRDGKQAVELATRACELTNWKNSSCLNTLAAAYAESGNFADALKWELKAQELRSPQHKKKWAFLLDLYKSGKPYREQPKKKPEKKAA